MGLIKIITDGSFGYSEVVFRAQDHGHAHCINKAMIYMNEIMRKSINLDHKLQGEGCIPDKGFEV